MRVRIDGSRYDLEEEITLDKNIKHNIEIIVDRLVIKEGIEKLRGSISSMLMPQSGQEKFWLNVIGVPSTTSTKARPSAKTFPALTAA